LAFIIRRNHGITLTEVQVDRQISYQRLIEFWKEVGKENARWAEIKKRLKYEKALYTTADE
jgi:hypothetical protein